MYASDICAVKVKDTQRMRRREMMKVGRMSGVTLRYIVHIVRI